MASTPETMAEPTGSGGPDIIDQLAGLANDSSIARLRSQRPEAKQHAQGSFKTLFESDDPASVSHTERELVALRVAVLTPSPVVAALHRERLKRQNVSDATVAAVERFPEGTALTPRQIAILRYTDRLTREPGAATPANIADLKNAGLSAGDIVTIAQLIAFVSYEVRVLVGLRLLEEEA